jgi:hypothetical protein
MTSEIEEGNRLAKLIAMRAAPRGPLPDVRHDAIACVKWRADSGASQASIAHELGVTTMTIRRWLPPPRAKAPRIRRVQGAGTASERGRPIVTTRRGLRIELFELDDADKTCPSCGELRPIQD